ncbi:MAG: alkaline phosphatase family protein [Luminiphilus sp.]
MLNRRLFAVALVWLTLTAVNSTAQAEAAASRKVVFVIVDGIPADVIERVPTPTIDAIARVGGYSRATVGGPVGEPGETPTISAPGYMSLVTGTWANKHNVYGNYGISPIMITGISFASRERRNPSCSWLYFRLGLTTAPFC